MPYRVLAAAAMLFALTTPALAIELPDGTYECLLDGRYGAGDMEIAGRTYRGPAFDRNYTGSYEFELDESNGNITFLGPVGGYTEPGFQLIGGLVVAVDATGTAGIQLQVRQDGGDNIHFVVCSPVSQGTD